MKNLVIIVLNMGIPDEQTQKDIRKRLEEECVETNVKILTFFTDGDDNSKKVEVYGLGEGVWVTESDIENVNEKIKQIIDRSSIKRGF
jgi:porphobilinogen deaminase